MQEKYLKIKIGSIKFSSAHLEGSDEIFSEISKRLGQDSLSALLADYAIRVKSAADGKYALVSGHSIFRLAKACYPEDHEISVKLCSLKDEIRPEIFEAVSRLVVPSLLGRKDDELLGVVGELNGHPGLAMLGRDLYREQTWRAILGKESGKRPYRRRENGANPGPAKEAVDPTAETDIPSGEPTARKRRRRKSPDTFRAPESAMKGEVEAPAKGGASKISDPDQVQPLSPLELAATAQKSPEDRPSESCLENLWAADSSTNVQ